MTRDVLKYENSKGEDLGERSLHGLLTRHRSVGLEKSGWRLCRSDLRKGSEGVNNWRLCRLLCEKAQPSRPSRLKKKVNSQVSRLSGLPERRRLSAQQAAKPHWRVASDFFTASGLRDGSTLVRNSMWSTGLGLLALNVLDANAANPSARQALQPPDPSVARGFRPVVFGMERHKQMRMSLIRKDIPALVVISRGPNGS